MAQIKTIDTVAGENQIDFKRRYPFVWLKNLGDTDVYISDKAGIIAEADGVVLLGAGQAAMLENYDDCVYVLGATTIEAHGQHSADSPFGDTIVAGGGGGGGSAVIQSLSATENKTYNVPTGVDGFNPVVVNVPAPVLIEKTITQNGVYDPEDDNADGYSMIDVDVPAVEVIELNANMNRTYTAPAGKAYSPVNVSVPGTSISKLTVGHNNVTYEAGIGTAFDPVEVSIPMDTLNAPSNGVYEIDTTTQDGWDTVLVDTYEKYNVLFFSNAVTINSQGFAKNIISEGYNDIWCVGYYTYSDAYGNNHTSLWCSRYPIATIFPLVSGRLFGCNGSDNYLWVTFNSTGDSAGTHLSSYDSPYMYIGFKNKDMTQDVLWQSTESSTPNTITLSESIFDYDEVCFFMIKSDGATSATWYLTSELEIGDIIRGYNNVDQSTYTIASNTTLTIATENAYRLYTVYGIKDNSMEKTTLYTNPDDTMPQTIDFSESYTNFDELVIEGHVSGGIVCEQRYPVIAFGRRSHIPADDRIQISTNDVSSWFTILSETSMSVDDSRIIVDKIIGIKRPVISTAHELIDVESLSVAQNGTYTAPSGTAYSPVIVDVYEKYHELYTGGANINPQICHFNNDVNTNNYDEFWLCGHYIATDSSGKNIHIWNGRYPTSVLSSIYTNNGFIGPIGSNNDMWQRPDSTGKFVTNVHTDYDYPYAFFGIKNKERTEECLWANTGSTTPSTVTLSESIFDYDEICLYFVKGDGATQTSWYLTDELSVGDVVQCYDNTTYPMTLNKYTIASNTTLTTLSESGGYVLMGIYGVNDTSLSETTLYANPDPTTAPATVTLSDSYVNYDEIVLIGHVPSEDTVCSYYYPVKILGRWTHDAYRDRIGVFSNMKSYWLTFTSNTTLVAEANPAIILDKIIGIKRPVLTTAHELIDVEPLSVTQNGTYTAPSGTAYSPVTVDIHNYGDVLFCNYSESSNNATLIKAYTNYEEIVLVAAFGSDTIVTQKIPTSQIAIGNNIGVCTDASFLWLRVDSTTSFTKVISSYNGVRLVKIIGMGEISND